MKWRGRARSENIQDRRDNRITTGRGQATGGRPRIRFGMPGRAGGGNSLGGILAVVVIVLAISLATGLDPLAVLTGEGPAPRESTASWPIPAAGEDELVDFIAVVLGETEELWTEVFEQNGLAYPPPVLVLFTDRDNSGCGLADARTGPFYCPADRTIYLDPRFYAELRDRFGAPGDFAQAYVLAHEVGHHVQNLTGDLRQLAELGRGAGQSEASAFSVRIELQADCYAGIWAAWAGRRNLLEAGDIEEALNAAEQIGDDMIQNRTTGFNVPRTFTHGTSEQRKRWFSIGYAQRDVGACDSFSPARP